MPRRCSPWKAANRAMNFHDFLGNTRVAETLRRLVVEDTLPQTLLFSGPRGVGKATLARIVAAAINCDQGRGEPCGACSNCLRILRSDLSGDEFQTQFEARDKLTSAQRAENPLIVSTHPDFLIFPPDGPLRIISIEQARRLRHAAAFGPSEGRHRIFLIDHADRANSEAANSLLKTLEEPAASLTLILTAENPYDLLPTIRSRAIRFHFSPLSAAEMREYFDRRPEIAEAARPQLTGWARGSPGRALSIDIDAFLGRRRVMLALVRFSLERGSFAAVIGPMESIARKKQEKLDLLTEMLYTLLEDLLHLWQGRGETLIHDDIRDELTDLAGRVRFAWLEQAAGGLAQLDQLARRNIQKQVALEAWALGLRRISARERLATAEPAAAR